MKNTMTTAKRNHLSLDECMDILDWFDDPQYDYIHHIYISKVDAPARLKRALPALRGYCMDLIIGHIGLENAYPLDRVA